MKKYEVTLTSVTPYMQHRMDDVKLSEWEKLKHKVIERDDVAKEDATRAEFHAYRDKQTGSCYIPAEHLKGALIGAGGMVKSKVGARSKSMKTIVAAMFFVSPEKVSLPDYDDIDKRSAVNKNVKARVITIRPKWTKWTATFTLLVDEDSITKDTIKAVLEYAGKYIGIGSFRPTNNGEFGRFEVAGLKELDPAK